MTFALADTFSPAQKAAHASKLSGLEAGRGIAALLVVAFHGWYHCRDFYGAFPLGKLFDFGHAGVDFFFVLSGFIIFHAHHRDIGVPSRLSRYIERRLTRIYPFYWIAFALMLLTIALSSHPFPRSGPVFLSLFLLPTVEPPVDALAWTLQQEMLFYTIFALLIVNWRLGRFAFAAWFVFLVGAAIWPVPQRSGLLVELSYYFNFEFFLGMSAAWLTARIRVPVPRSTVTAGFLAFVAIGMAEDAGWAPSLNVFTHLGYGLAAMAMVVGLVGWERRGDFKVPPLLATLGSASYSIYLTHILSIGTIWQIFRVFGAENRLPPWGAYLLLVTGAAAAGVAMSYLVEKPVIALVRRRLIAFKAPRLQPGMASPYDATKL